MYVKPSNRQTRGLYVPDNYNGTAFAAPAPEQDAQSETAQEAAAILPEAPATSKSQESTPAGGLLAGLGSLRSDDLLLLALIVLMSRSDGQGQQSCSDILPLLALLLFLG